MVVVNDERLPHDAVLARQSHRAVRKQSAREAEAVRLLPSHRKHAVSVTEVKLEQLLVFIRILLSLF